MDCWELKEFMEQEHKEKLRRCEEYRRELKAKEIDLYYKETQLERAMKETQWISVKDRLPKDKTRCIMTMQHDDLKTVEEGLFVDNTWFWQNFPLQHWTVIAWKPWPEPWEGEG